MTKTKPSFEDNMNRLEQIVNKLENGDIPLEQALTEFKRGVKLSNQLQKTLSQAEHTLTHIETYDNQEVNFEEKEPSNTTHNDEPSSKDDN